MNYLKKLAIVAVLFSSENVFSGTIRHDVPDRKYLSYGEDHKCVFKLNGIIEKDGKEIQYFGSCVAISDQWIVTAAHVVEDSKRNFLIVGKKEIPIEKTIICPEYTGSFGSTDLAICKLSEKLDLPFYPEMYSNNDEIGKVCGIAGFGKTGTGLTGARLDAGEKRAGSNKIESVSEGALYCVMDRKRPTELEFLISHGDSGGGLFIDGKLAGINSSVLCSDGETDSNYGDESCHTRISKYIGWIKETIEKNSQ